MPEVSNRQIVANGTDRSLFSSRILPVIVEVSCAQTLIEIRIARLVKMHLILRFLCLVKLSIAIKFNDLMQRKAEEKLCCKLLGQIALNRDRM
ncbi:MAG: hypothetical protein AB9888_17670 [Bacteroidales bacterium]